MIVTADEVICPDPVQHFRILKNEDFVGLGHETPAQRPWATDLSWEGIEIALKSSRVGRDGSASMVAVQL
jgi:hypothetical protein